MARCRGCGSEIAFSETPKGKLMPIDADGVSHFARCAAAPRNRKPAPPEDTCAGCRSHDVERLPGQGPHYGAIKCRECGQHRWLRRPE